jgi:chromosome partitioning protein
MITVAFFSNKGGVGTTTIVSHLACMFAERGIPVLAVDLDPQCNLSSTCVGADRLSQLWHEEKSILASVAPLLTGRGDVIPAHLEEITPNLHLLVGHLGLSRFEDLLAESWSRSLSGEPGAFCVMSAFHRLMTEAAARISAGIVLIDLGQSLGALNRAALLAADHLVLPIAPDLFALRGMESLGAALRDWRHGWHQRVKTHQEDMDTLPAGRTEPIGYVLRSLGARDSRALPNGNDWSQQIPGVYRRTMLQQQNTPAPTADEDPYRLATLKSYRSLMSLASLARKPMFLLRAADGARGAHVEAVAACYHDFLSLARRIGQQVGVDVP